MPAPRLLRRLSEVLIRGPDAPFLVTELEDCYERDIERGLSPSRRLESGADHLRGRRGGSNGPVERDRRRGTSGTDPRVGDHGIGFRRVEGATDHGPRAPRVTQAHEDILRRLRAEPGVRRVALGRPLPGMEHQVAGDGASRFDPSVILATLAIFMMLVGFVACLGPALRGLRIRPVEALRE